MKIREKEIREYLQYITVVYFAHADAAPANLEEYDACIRNMIYIASAHDKKELVRKMFAYLLKHPQVEAKAFAGDRYPYTESQVREIIRYAYCQIWPSDDPANEDTSDVEIVQ